MNIPHSLTVYCSGKNSRYRVFLWILSFALTAFIAAPHPAAAAGMTIAECFEGPATEFANKFGKQNTLAKGMYEMKAGSVCDKLASQIIEHCVARPAAADDSAEGQDRYVCIGKVINPCWDSAWGTTEIRRIACVRTEEKVWLGLLNGHLKRLQKTLPPAMAERAGKMKKSFFNYRNDKCDLLKSLSKSNQPNLAYGTCMAETAARFALDLNRQKPLADMAAQSHAAKEFPGNRAGAEKLLKRFLSGKADLRELTLQLKPHSADYGAAYQQPLAGRLEQDHQALWSDPDLAIRPKKDQSALLLTLAKTDRLKKGGAVLDKFPGGYEKILPYLKPGLVIARFTFTAPEDSKGLAFDGLMHVNGRWVLIPKPWRALP